MPIITDVPEEGKEGRFIFSTNILLAVILILSCTGSFGLGYLAGKEGQGGEVYITPPAGEVSGIEGETSNETKNRLLASPSVSIHTETESAAPSAPMPSGGQYVASKSGSKYHLPWCPGAKQIKESNKIYFDSKEAAEKAGYTPAANCKGI